MLAHHMAEMRCVTVGAAHAQQLTVMRRPIASINGRVRRGVWAARDLRALRAYLRLRAAVIKEASDRLRNRCAQPSRHSLPLLSACWFGRMRVMPAVVQPRTYSDHHVHLGV